MINLIPGKFHEHNHTKIFRIYLILDFEWFIIVQMGSFKLNFLFYKIYFLLLKSTYIQEWRFKKRGHIAF